MVTRTGSNIYDTGGILKLIKLPDLLSICNALFGFSAILIVLADQSAGAIKTALAFILVAVVIDGLDGLAARTVESSPIGRYLDSLADMNSFGIAPAIVTCSLYKSFSFSHLTYTHIELVSAFCSAYVICGMLRLARFDANTAPEKEFVGFPITGSAILLASFMLLSIEVDLPCYPAILVILMGMLCLLMISRIRYVKLRDLRIQVGTGIVFSLLFICYAASLQLFIYPTAVIVALTSLYIASPIIRPLLNRKYALLQY